MGVIVTPSQLPVLGRANLGRVEDFLGNNGRHRNGDPGVGRGRTLALARTDRQ
jgi:hypothetical protein